MSDVANQLSAIMAPLNPWLQDTATEDIALNRPYEAWVRQNGRFLQVEVPLDYDDLYDIAVLAGALNRQNVGDRHPLLAADLPRGERLQAVLPPCVPPGTVSLTMRVHASNVVPIDRAAERYDLSRWNQWGNRHAVRRQIDQHVIDLYDAGDAVGFFKQAIRSRLNILFCGATGSGKTTCFKSVIAEIDADERLLTIENALELQIVNQPNHVRLLYSHGDQGVAAVDQRQLLEACLRMRPDRVLVGELRDPDAAYTYANELMTGHPGSPSTIHGADASQAVTRLFNLIKGSAAGRGYSDEMLISQLGMVVDIVIPFREDAGRFSINEVWFNVDAKRRGADIRELLEV